MKSRKAIANINRKWMVFLCYFLVFIIKNQGQVVAQSTEKLYLSGTGNDNTVPWEFYCTGGMNAGKWTTIPVPSCWELQGFGKYDYGFAKDSVRGREQGIYKYHFRVPEQWKNKQVNIVFEGSMTDTEVKINGQSAGEIHRGAFYAFKYDITKRLKFGGENLLEVTVAKHSSDASVNAAERNGDFWIFGGIFRPVWLEALPVDHIERVAIDAKANGDFKARVYIKGKNITGASVKILNQQGKLVKSVYLSDQKEGDTALIYYGRLISPALWTPETPSLYTAVFTLVNRDTPLHKVQQKFGFRTIQIKYRDGIYVNGVKVKMKGVNRHSFWPTSGRTTSKKISIEDVLLMKDMNMNAVRMSHYPPDDHFLDVCDSLGLFVMDELAGWHGHYSTVTGAKLLKEMIDHDGNHPSIVLWSNGNEGGHNLQLDTLFDQYDIQQRAVVHPWENYGGIETQHYRQYDYGIGNYDHGHSIIMPTEFLHGWFDGGHGAGLEDYWEMMWHKPLYAGGFLWDFADQAVVRRDLNDSLDTDNFRAADGIMGPYHEKEGSYYAIKAIWSPVHFEEKEITFGSDANFPIENRYHFTNINQCKFSYELKSWDPAQASVKGTINAPDIKPLQTGILKVNPPAGWMGFEVLYITVKDKFNREIMTKSFPLIQPFYFDRYMAKDHGSKVPELIETDSLFVVTAKEVKLSFHKRTGILFAVEVDNNPLPFNNGPVIQEGVNNFSGLTARQVGSDIIISSKFDRKSGYNTLQWIIYPSGLVRMEVNYFPAEFYSTMVGVNFSFPENRVRQVEYMGYGPYRVWKNRMKGGQFGVWKKDYNKTETGEYPWIYPEFKGYYANMYWSRFFLNDNRSFYVGTETEDVFLRLFTPAWKTDQWHNYEPIFPSGDISFMQGIPAIGTKSQTKESTGPMGMKYGFYDYEKDPARALKLVLWFNFR
jgi:hypothetical protein